MNSACTWSAFRVKVSDESFRPPVATSQICTSPIRAGNPPGAQRGLDSLRRLPDARLDLSAADIAKAAEWDAEREAARQRERGTETLSLTPDSAPGFRSNSGPICSTSAARATRRSISSSLNSRIPTC